MTNLSVSSKILVYGIAFTLTFGILIAFLPGVASAQAMLEMRCDLVQKRIELVVTRYENNYERNAQKYEQLVGRVDEALSDLESKGYDVGEVEADVNQMREYINTYVEQKAAVVEQLKVAQGYDCGNSSSEFASAMKEVVQLSTQARQTGLTMRVFYQTELRQSLLDLKSQQPE